MYGRELSERKKQILKAIIDAHIAEGEPVGSKYLMQSISSSSAISLRMVAEEQVSPVSVDRYFEPTGSPLAM